jgi:hypothetical protein
VTQGELFPEIPKEVTARVLAAMADQAMSQRARAVLERVRLAVGRDNAVSIYALQFYWRFRELKAWTDRDVKAAVKELVEERGVPIGSARCGTPGYFLCVTPEDIDAAERPLLNEVRSLAKRLRAMNPKSEISRTLCGQLGIE